MFEFSLEKLLKYKEELEKSAERALREAIESRRNIEELLRQADGRLQASFSEDKPRILPDSLHIDFFRASLCHRVEALKERLNDAEREVEAYRGKLVEARKECLLLVKLKEKQFQDYLAEINYKEQVTNDDLVTARFRHNSP